MAKHTTPGYQYYLLPLIASLYQPVFHYANNVNILLLSSLIRVAILNVSIAFFLVTLILLIIKKPPIIISMVGFIFLIFYNTYGLLYKYFLNLDIFQVEHYALLPFYIVLAIYISLLLIKIPVDYLKKVWIFATGILGILLLFNVIRLIPAEINKSTLRPNQEAEQLQAISEGNNENPDIYYIVFDEYSGFPPMREYWHNVGVDDFVLFLKSEGFFVAEQSHSSSIITFIELATRLNYQEYSLDSPGIIDTSLKDIADNRAMRFLESQGYTTVVFSELQYPYPSASLMLADYSYNYSQDSGVDLGLLFDEFGIMTAENTMLCAFSRLYTIDNPATDKHRNMILFTQTKIEDLEEVPSPKFVYVHFMFPHLPFLFDKNGLTVDPTFYYNWNYYLGNYQYATLVAENMVRSIVDHANPSRPPIIILQSDHGARNLSAEMPGSVILEDFPEEYKTSIMFAMYLPGYDISSLPQDLDPINTFPLIFNYLFGTNIPIK